MHELSSKRLEIALERTQKREDIYDDAALRGVSVSLLMRLEREHQEAVAVSNFEQRVQISMDAKRAHSALEDQVLYMIEKYEALAKGKST